MRMEPTHYLPSEVLKNSNYPELKAVEGKLDGVMLYAMRVDSALHAYSTGTTNRIDVDPTELRKWIEQCREVCEVLGNAPRVCFDVLMELRSMQTSFQELLFMHNRYGNEYVGVPSPTSEENEWEGGN